MTTDELKVYIEKQIDGCKWRIEFFEEAKKLKINTSHQDALIEMQMEQLDFYFTIKKDLEVLDILSIYIDYSFLSRISDKDEYEKVEEWMKK